MKRLKSLHQWFFGFGSPLTIGVFRIIFGFLAFVCLLLLSTSFGDWYSVTGYVTPDIAREVLFGKTYPDFLNGIESNSLILIAFVATTVSAFLVMIGLFARVATIVLALGLIGLHHRNIDILNSGDTLMRLIAIYMVFAPSGAACSLDRLIRRWKGKEGAALPEVSLWPQRLIGIQVALLYLTTAWHKSFGGRWLDGTATYYTGRLEEFERFPVPGLINEQPMVMIATYYTLLIEVALGILVFAKPTRKWVLIGGLVLHGGIEYGMNIPLFAFVICSTYIVYYDGDEIAGWFKRLAKRFSERAINVSVPGASSKGKLEVLESLSPLGLVKYTPVNGEPWVANRADGRAQSWVTASLARSMGAWLLWIAPPLWASIVRSSAVEDSSSAND